MSFIITAILFLLFVAFIGIIIAAIISVRSRRLTFFQPQPEFNSIQDDKHIHIHIKYGFKRTTVSAAKMGDGSYQLLILPNQFDDIQLKEYFLRYLEMTYPNIQVVEIIEPDKRN